MRERYLVLEVKDVLLKIQREKPDRISDWHEIGEGCWVLPRRFAVRFVMKMAEVFEGRIIFWVDEEPTLASALVNYILSETGIQPIGSLNRSHETLIHRHPNTYTYAKNLSHLRNLGYVNLVSLDYTHRAYSVFDREKTLICTERWEASVRDADSDLIIGGRVFSLLVALKANIYLRPSSITYLSDGAVKISVASINRAPDKSKPQGRDTSTFKRTYEETSLRDRAASLVTVVTRK